MILFFLNCNDKKDNEVIYKQPPAEKLDAVCTWLNNDDHFFESNYKPVFYNYYNLKIKQKDFKAASKVLEIVSNKNVIHDSFDQKFFETINTFSTTYKNEIPKANTTFIDSYLGNYYDDKGNFKKAIEAYKKTTELDVVDYQTCFNKGDGYTNIAWCYYSMGQQDLALAYCKKAMIYFNKTDRAELMGTVYNNLSLIYIATKDYINAEKSLNKAIQYHSIKYQERKINIFICLYNKIELYDKTNNYVKRNRLIDSTYAAFCKSDIEDTSIKTSIYSYYIEKLFDENKLEEAKKLLDELEPEVKALNSDYTTNEFKVSKALYEIKKNKGIQDTKLIVATIPSLKENENFQDVRELYHLLYEDAVKKKDFKNALSYFKEMTNATDSLGSREIINKIVELETKYKTQKKEQQIQLQEKTILNKNAAIALLAFMFIVMFLIVVVYVMRQKQKKLKIESENVQHYTKLLLEKTEEERKRIASDLHDSVSHELLSLKNSFVEKTNVIDTKIDAIINDIRVISRNLHPVMFDKVGLKSSIEQLVARAQSAHNFMVTADLEYSESLSKSEELQVYRIIQESLSNIIKYANALAAKITIKDKDNSLFIEIKDNGQGFDVDEKLNSKNAFGLYNIIERSRAIGGEAKITSDSNGTIIKIEINK